MDKNSELEGEACFHEDEGYNIHLDTAFSYIDEKIKNVLGHFQKDFEGEVSAENLGAKFGGYGSFLPTYERSPPRLSHSETPQRNSPANNFSMEGASQNLEAPLNGPSTGRPRNISCPSSNIAAKHDMLLTSAIVAEKSSLKDESFKRAEIPSDQKTLKVRIKMWSDKKEQNVAAIYSGLGLDFSPSSSLGNSPDDSGGTLKISQETASETPSSILQVMTSNHVPGGVLISPLYDNLLCLLRKEKERPSRENKPIPLFKACEKHPSVLVDESVLGNRKQLNEKKTNFLIGKNEELVESKNRNRMNVESEKTLFVKKKHETETAEGESFPNDLKHTAPTGSVNIAVEASTRVCDVSAEANHKALRGGLFSSDSAKEDALESISGRSRSSGKRKKRDKLSSLDEKDWEQSVDNSNKNASLDLGDNVGSKCYQNSAPSKLEEDSKTKVGQVATSRVQNKLSIPSKKEKTLFEGKKSKGSKNNGEVADSLKESLKHSVVVTLEDTSSSIQGFSSGKEKIQKLKLHKGINKVQDNHRDELETNFEQKSGQMEPTMSHFQNRPKDYCPMDFETEHTGHLDKSKVKFCGRMVDNQLSGVDAPDVVPHLTDKRLATQTAAPAATAPVVIEENWVQCDRCHKWRLLPFDTRPEQLPEKWLCSMLNWLPRMNRCDISEDDTTKALNALYQVPVAENQNNSQNLANGSVSLVTSAQPQHLDQNNSSFNSQAFSVQGKRNHGLKEVLKEGSSGLNQMSNSRKKQQKESLKSKSLNGMTQAPVESIIMKKSTYEEKERLLVGGETKKTKMKNKRESGPYAYEGSKKSKAEIEYTTDRHHSSNLDHRRVGLNSSTSLPTQANGSSVQNNNGGSNSGDVKHDIKEKSVASVKKLVDQTRASSDGRSLDMRICDKRAPVKKRKLEDWQDSKIGNESCMKEESSGSGFRDEKKLRFSKIEGKQSNRNDGDGTPNRKSMDHLVGGIEVRCIDRNQKLSNHKKKSSSKKELDSLDSLKRDSGTGQISAPATSSSSKVSGSRKTRATFEEARGSPVESVSSSPMRTSYPEKLASTAGSGKDAANSGIPSSGNLRRCWNGKGTFELAQSCTEMEENMSGDFNPGFHKSSTLDYRDKDSICKISIRSKPSSRLGNSHVLNGDSHSAENVQHTIERSHNEDILNKECGGNALFSHKSKKASTSQKKYNKRISAADNMKCSEDEKNYSGRRNPSGKPSSDSRMETQLDTKHDEVDVKSAVPCSKKGNNAPEKNMIQDSSGKSKVILAEVRSGMPKSSLRSETESWQEKKGHRTVPEAEVGVPVNGSSSIDPLKALKHPAKPNSKNACSPVRENSSSLTVTNALNDANGLRNYADRLKCSGFVFESNEIYFQAALKFLGVAALLGTSNSENGRHGDMNQMQVYSTATKLCEMCAQEYEKGQKLAAAALAYKCVEVAYMRVVYCKQSSSSRDLKELQATLQMVPQGESPSSCVSDVDNNLNNQAIVDKAPLAGGNVSHVAGTHVVVARNRPSFGRLLDFTQDASFAMEAMRKSQTCFIAATSSLEEEVALDFEWIASVKKVIDFSFQDVDEFISLVQQATQAVGRSG